jgi:hypothetical protein
LELTLGNVPTVVIDEDWGVVVLIGSDDCRLSASVTATVLKQNGKNNKGARRRLCSIHALPQVTCRSSAGTSR